MGQRSEPEGSAFSGIGFADGGFHMSFGIGGYPFGFFMSTFNFGDNRPNAGKLLSFICLSSTYCRLNELEGFTDSDFLNCFNTNNSCNVFLISKIW